MASHGQFMLVLRQVTDLIKNKYTQEMRTHRAIDRLFEASSEIEKIFLILFSEIIYYVVFLWSRSNQYPAPSR